MIADIIRYQALYFYGGIYIDADSKCLQPFTPILDSITITRCNVMELCQQLDIGEKECFAGYENENKRPGLIANGVIGCAQYHYSCLCLIDFELIRYSRTMLMMLHRMQYTDWNSPVWAAVGPLLLTEVHRIILWFH